jgi:hypothetical protein
MELYFTRYLYIVPDVYCSLLCSLFEKKTEEALFWAFELIYSGLEDPLVAFLMSVYSLFYEETYPIKLKTYLQKMANQWKKTRDPIHIASLLSNIVYRFAQPNDVFSSIVVYPEIPVAKRTKLFFIEYTKPYEDIYGTRLGKDEPKHRAYQVLKEVSLYPLRKHRWQPVLEKYPELSVYLQHKNPIESKTFLFEHWLFLTYHTPIWKRRIEETRGILLQEKQRIVWENEEDEEAFHVLYGYELDEQPTEIQTRILGQCL